MNYFEHRLQAADEYENYIIQCAKKNDISYDADEISIALADWYECEQIRMLHTGEVKIKWEARCWWADCSCHMGTYYCILAPLDEVTWYEPYALAVKRSRGEEQ